MLRDSRGIIVVCQQVLDTCSASGMWHIWIFTQFHPFSPVLTHFLLISPHVFFSRLISGCEGKAGPEREETWYLFQCWTDLVRLLEVDAQVYAAIVGMHIPLLGTPSCPHTSFAPCFGVDHWGQGVLHQVGWLPVPVKVVGNSDEGYVELEYHQDGLRVVNHRCPMDFISFDITSFDSPAISGSPSRRLRRRG